MLTWAAPTCELRLAGIGLLVGSGLALTASLERFGITPVVAEIGDASLSRGLALMLTGNAGMALRRVGLDQVVADRGVVLERLLGSFPVGPGLVYAFLLLHSAQFPALARDERLARFKELAAQFSADVAALIARQQDPARVVFVPVHEVQTPSYHRARIVLIGDAAHWFPPLLAQSAAMAIEDAVALAESLDRYGDVDQALRSYGSRRRPRTETIRAAVRRVTIMRGMEGAVTPELLQQHPAVFSPSLKAFDELIEDPFTPSQGAT